MNLRAEDEDMNIFSPDPYDRDAARARAELAALSARADAQADQRRSQRGRRERGHDDTITFRPSSWLAHFARGLRAVWHEQVEAQERLAIINRPWIHEKAHWHELTDGSMVLHGDQVPPDRRAIPVTAGGWCPTVDPELEPARMQTGRPAERIIRPADRLT
jgi:hypothetical protein